MFPLQTVVWPDLASVASGANPSISTKPEEHAPIAVTECWVERSLGRCSTTTSTSPNNRNPVVGSDSTARNSLAKRLLQNAQVANDGSKRFSLRARCENQKESIY
jgi:hypothetical protein